MTNKILPMIAAMLLLNFQVSSQDKKETEARKYIFGLKGGANFAWYKPDTRNLSKAGFKPGFSYGIMADIVFQKNYSLSTEFLVSNINGKLKFKDPLTFDNDINHQIANPVIPNVRYEYSVKYVQIPISLKFRTKEIGAMKYFAQFGLAPGVRIASSVKIVANGMPWNEDDRSNIKTNKDSDEIFEPDQFDDDVNLINLPLLIGGGVEYNLSGNTSLYSNLRFENGFSKILQSKTGTETSVFSKNIALSIGVFF